jgi:hypothetical protein
MMKGSPPVELPAQCPSTPLNAHAYARGYLPCMSMYQPAPMPCPYPCDDLFYPRKLQERKSYAKRYPHSPMP